MLFSPNELLTLFPSQPGEQDRAGILCFLFFLIEFLYFSMFVFLYFSISQLGERDWAGADAQHQEAQVHLQREGGG